MDNAFLLSVVGVLISFVIAILCFFLKGILGEMKSLNDKLIKVVTNQEWHFKSILELQAGEEKFHSRLTIMENQINRNKRGVEL